MQIQVDPVDAADQPDTDHHRKAGREQRGTPVVGLLQVRHLGEIRGRRGLRAGRIQTHDLGNRLLQQFGVVTQVPAHIHGSPKFAEALAFECVEHGGIHVQRLGRLHHRQPGTRPRGLQARADAVGARTAVVAAGTHGHQPELGCGSALKERACSEFGNSVRSFLLNCAAPAASPRVRAARSPTSSISGVALY